MTEGAGKTGAPAAVPEGGEGALPPDEFAHIPSRRGRPPLLALFAVALALLLAYRLRQDLSFALSSATPIDVGDAGLLASRPISELPINRTVRITGTPERESAVMLDTQGSWRFTQLFRLRATGGRVFVRRVADPLPVRLAERDEFIGRLLPFSDLTFSRSIGKYFASRVSATHFFSGSDLFAALSGGPPLHLRDLAGDQVTLTGQDRLFIDLLRPGELEVELPRERVKDQAVAARAVADAGARVTGERHTPDRWIFIAAVAPEDQAPVTSALGDIDRAARLRPARDTVEAAVADLSPAGDGDGRPGLSIRRQGGALGVPLDRIGAIRTRSPVQIPADALLLVEGERPRDAWKSVVIFGFLVAFVVVNLLALRRPS